MLWLPDDPKELFLVTIDPNQSGQTEWDGMLLVNNAAAQWLDSSLDTGTYMDILESVGLDPVAFVSDAENYVYNALHFYR